MTAGVAEWVADPAELPVERLEMQLKGQAAHVAAAMCRWLLLVAEYDRRGAYERWEQRSCAEWLAFHCGVASATAREYVRVARRLVELPVVTARFAAGELSYSKVRALCRAATPETEGELVDLALELSAAQLDRTMRVLERSAREVSDEQLERISASRGYDEWVEDSGLHCILLRVSPDEAETVRAAMAVARDVDFAHAKAADAVGPRRGAGLARLDALLLAVELGHAALMVGEDELPTRHTMQIHVNEPPWVDEQGLVVLGPGIRLHPKMARRLGCDVQVELVAGCAEAVGLNLGRKVRTFTRRQRRAIAKRYPVCAFPGCEVDASRCQFHHLVPWEDGGLTDLDNGVPLCRFHHHAVHDRGWSMFKVRDTSIVVISPDGRRMSERPPVVAAPEETLEALHDRLGLDVVVPASPSSAPGADLRWVIDVLLGNLTVTGSPLWDSRRLREVSLN